MQKDISPSEKLKKIIEATKDPDLWFYARVGMDDVEWLIARVKALEATLKDCCICWKICPRPGENPNPRTCRACKILDKGE